MKTKLKVSKTDAEMADVNVMAKEIADRLKPVERKIYIEALGREITVTEDGHTQRVKGPERVALSHNKNSTTIGEKFPWLEELKAKLEKEKTNA